MSFSFDQTGNTYESPHSVISQMMIAEPPWRNWLARSAVNRKVGGSSPPGGATFSPQKTFLGRKKFDPGRTRTCNPLIRSQMPYPLGHRATSQWEQLIFQVPPPCLLQNGGKYRDRGFGFKNLMIYIFLPACEYSRDSSVGRALD